MVDSFNWLLANSNPFIANFRYHSKNPLIILCKKAREMLLARTNIEEGVNIEEMDDDLGADVIFGIKEEEEEEVY